MEERWGSIIDCCTRKWLKYLCLTTLSKHHSTDDQKSNKLCRLVSSVQSHIRPFYSQYRSLVTDCRKISIESPNSRRSSSSETQGQLVGMKGFSWAKVYYKGLYCFAHKNPFVPISCPWVSEDGLSSQNTRFSMDVLSSCKNPPKSSIATHEGFPNLNRG